MNTLTAWWQGRNSRERMVLVVGAVIVGLLLMVLGILQPINARYLAMQQQLTQKQQLASWMHDSENSIKQLATTSANTQDINPDMLLATVDTALRDSSLSPTQIEQQANGYVLVNFTNTGFDAMMQWLITLWQQYGIAAKQVSITPTQVGNVDAKISLSLAS